MTVYLVHDYFDPTGNIAPAPGFYFDEVIFLLRTVTEIGYDVVCINGLSEFCMKIFEIREHDIVFNIVSGSGSRNREALVPALCECHGLNYIGTDAFGVALPMHKYQLKLFIEKLGVCAPGAFYFDPLIHDKSYFDSEILKITPPYILKPNHENMSRGVKLFSSAIGTYEYAYKIYHIFNQACVVEEYIAGKELAVTLVGTGKSARVYGAIQYKSSNLSEIDIFDGKKKEKNDIVYVSPDVSDELAEYIKSKSLIIHKGLGLKDFSRADWRVTKKAAYFLEITPIPCLAEGTEFHFSSENSGVPFGKFIQEAIAGRRSSVKR